MEREHTVLLGLGANQGSPRAQLAAALVRLAAHVRITGRSSLWRTEPVGHADQPDFLNLVCAGSTTLPAAALLRACQRIEADLGRTRPFPNAPRTVDIDLLAYGDAVVDTPALVLPHPRLHLRAFVLAPLAEVAPEWRHPLLGRTAAELLAAGGPWERVEREGPLGAG